MKKIIIFSFSLLILVSCSSKKYKYVEFEGGIDVLGEAVENGKDPIEIFASSDSAAYLEAFEKFCIASKVYSDMVKDGMGEHLAIPIRFALYDENGKDIASFVSFATKKQKEKEIRDMVLGLDSSMSSINVGETKKAVIDSTKIKELSPYFNIKKDEFDSNGKMLYEPKSAPKYANRNGIYCYFSVQNGTPDPLRFRVQYYADDWLFFGRLKFSIDDKAFEFIPLETETDCGDGGMIWEWFDEPLSNSDKELIYALSNAKSAKMKFIGKQYYDIKTITKAQITDIKRTLDLYHAMGGEY